MSAYHPALPTATIGKTISLSNTVTFLPSRRALMQSAIVINLPWMKRNEICFMTDGNKCVKRTHSWYERAALSRRIFPGGACCFNIYLKKERQKKNTALSRAILQSLWLPGSFTFAPFNEDGFSRCGWELLGIAKTTDRYWDVDWAKNANTHTSEQR